MILIVMMSGCTAFNGGTYLNSDSKNSNLYPPGDVRNNQASATGVGTTMAPYMMLGKDYFPVPAKVGDISDGSATWYDSKNNGAFTFSQEKYSMYAMTAAHKTLPLNTLVKVTNLKNGRSTVVRINDRGPFEEGKIIRLSYVAAKEIGIFGDDKNDVSLEVVGLNSAVNPVVNTATIASKATTDVLVAPNSGNFAVQLGAFAIKSGAILTQKKYATFHGYEASIKEVNYRGKPLFRVLLHGFKNEIEARNFVKQGYVAGSFITKE
jgi:rare lipoprotein A